MDKDALEKQFEAFLEKPNENILEKLTGSLKEYSELPGCPKCSSKDIVKLGTNHRKSGPTQQYRCKECRHIYSDSSLKSKVKRDRYPSCPRCGGRVEKNGSWSWVLKNGTRKKKQKYHCTKCNHYARKKKPKITGS